MNKTKITIKDVAEKSGVSLASVHRALNDKPGVSEETRRMVKATAEQVGYKPNLFAASLKRRAIRIAAIMVSPDYVGRFYFNDLWRGCDEFLFEYAEYDIDFLRLPFSDDDGPMRKLEYIWKTYGTDIDGILITPTNSVSLQYNAAGTKYFIDKFTEAGIPIVFVGNDVENTNRLCCVRPDIMSSNQLAAEYICSLVPDYSNVLICSRTKDVPSQICNIRLFEQSLAEMGHRQKLLKVYQQEKPDSQFGDMQELVYKDVVGLLQSHPEIQVLYSCNARGTIPMAKALQDLGLAGKVKMIGNDVFTESIAFLEQGVITALLFKDPKQQGYIGLKTLFNYVVKNDFPSANTIYVATTIVMKSNLQFFL